MAAGVAAAVLAHSATLCVLEAWTQLYLGDALAAIRSIRAAELAHRTRAVRPTRRRRAAHAARRTAILRTISGVTRYDLPDVRGLKAELPHAFGPEDPLQRAYAHVVLGYAERLAGRWRTRARALPRRCASPTQARRQW